MEKKTLIVIFCVIILCIDEITSRPNGIAAKAHRVADAKKIARRLRIRSALTRKTDKYELKNNWKFRKGPIGSIQPKLGQ